MKTLRLFLAGAAALMCAATASSAPINPAETDIETLRIYINPGHGSWTGGDRALPTIKHGPYNSTAPDTTGFFESNTNLWKCLSMVDKLREYGLKFDGTLNQDNPNPARRGPALDMHNNIVMSHVKLGPYPVGSGDAHAYNRDLYEIACEVERNNFDFFISVHSNAHTDGSNTNYPALFVRGENRTASVEGSDDACRVFWPFAFQDEHQTWSTYSMTNPALYYDIDFQHGDYAINNIDGKQYKGYYGVLRHGVIGFLCEGYFHTYQPARHRAMNMDVCRHEGIGYAHGLAAIFGIPTESYGELYGIVRDRHERFRHTYYNCSASSYDAMKPINNAEVVLYKGGQEISRYTTDDEFNGAFVFTGLEPGNDYTVAVTAPGYKPAHEDFCGPFTVEASKTTYPRVYLESEDYVPPAVSYSDYPDEAAGADGILAAPSYAFKRVFTDKTITALKDKTVRRLIVRDRYIYVLALDAESKPTVVVLNSDNLSQVAQVSTDGCEGTEYALSDIQVTSDGQLIGCSMELCHLTDEEVEEGEERGVCNIYRWTNDDNGVPSGAPRIWFTTMMTGNLFKAWTGQSMAYTGTLQEGRMLLSSASCYYNRKIFFTIIDIVDGAKSSEGYSNKSDVCDYFNVDDLQDFTFTISPLSSQSFIANSTHALARQYTINDMALETELSEAMSPKASGQAGFFRFAGHSMMVAPAVDADSKNIGLRLLDITDGLDKARLVETTNTELKASEGIAAAAGRTEVVRDEEDRVTAAYMHLYILRPGGKITRMTTKGVEQPVEIPAYAYNPSIGELSGANGYNISFSLTDAADVFLRLRDKTAGTVVDLDAVSLEKGENSLPVYSNNIPEGEYEVDIVVDNKAVAGVKELFRNEIESSGVAVDCNPASPFFGNAYFTIKAGERGVMQYDPMFTPATEAPYQSGGWDLSIGGSCFRASTLADGTLLVSDFGDKQGGIYVIDPANPSTPRYSMFEGTQNPASGEWTNAQGQVIGGSTSDMCALGSGENQVLYSFQEDYPSDYSLSMVSYNIGTAHTISTVPDATYPELSRYLLNGNVNVVARPQALFLSQTRGSGNNTANVPVVLIADYDQNILFNSGNDWETLGGGDGALAVNADATLMAVTDVAQNVHIMRLNWESGFKAEHIYSFPLGSDTNTYQMAFDPAGRLFVANRAFTAAYAVPQPESQAITETGLTFKAVSGVEDITVDTDNSVVEYYNLQGIRMDGDNLAPGIYIRRQGNTVTKVRI